MEQARFNMVEQQIRSWNVLDLKVLDLLHKSRREQFISPAMQAMAFMDVEIPLGHGAAMWPPKLEAHAVQALRLKPRDRVLEIGAGSGYLASLLSRMAEHVTSVELVPELLAFAEKNLAACRIDNVTLMQGDGARGWTGNYDAIVLSGSLPVLPEAFLTSLNAGGRLFAVVGDAPVMHAQLVTCTTPGKYETATLFETSVPPLQNALQPERFVF
jgi:protein-L-isoaspartate(D-aspartate) O-methyltransferase